MVWFWFLQVIGHLSSTDNIIKTDVVGEDMVVHVYNLEKGKIAAKILTHLEISLMFILPSIKQLPVIVADTNGNICVLL